MYNQNGVIHKSYSNNLKAWAIKPYNNHILLRQTSIYNTREQHYCYIWQNHIVCRKLCFISSIMQFQFIRIIQWKAISNNVWPCSLFPVCFTLAIIMYSTLFHSYLIVLISIINQTTITLIIDTVQWKTYQNKKNWVASSWFCKSCLD